MAGDLKAQLHALSGCLEIMKREYGNRDGLQWAETLKFCWLAHSMGGKGSRAIPPSAWDEEADNELKNLKVSGIACADERVLCNDERPRKPEST